MATSIQNAAASDSCADDEPGERRSDDEADLVDRLVQRRRRRRTARGARAIGTTAARVGPSMPDSPAAIDEHTKIGHTAGASSVAFTASPTLHTASAACVNSSSRRRSRASASEPPTSEPRSSGGSWASDSRPTCERRVGQQEELERRGDDGELAAEERDELAGPEQPVVPALPERA